MDVTLHQRVPGAHENFGKIPACQRKDIHFQPRVLGRPKDIGDRPKANPKAPHRPAPNFLLRHEEIQDGLIPGDGGLEVLLNLFEAPFRIVLEDWAVNQGGGQARAGKKSGEAAFQEEVVKKEETSQDRSHADEGKGGELLREIKGEGVRGVEDDFPDGPSSNVMSDVGHG